MKLRVKSKPFRDEPEQLLVAFLEEYLSAPGYSFKVQGAQQGFEQHPGLLLFEGPKYSLLGTFVPTTFAIETDLLLRPRHEVLAIIREKFDRALAATPALAAMPALGAA